MFLQPYTNLIDNYFNEQGLYVPPTYSLKNLNVTTFKVVDGKKLLFEDENCLFERIKNISNNELKINRLTLAQNMDYNEIHQDIEEFFENLKKITNE